MTKAGTRLGTKPCPRCGGSGRLPDDDVGPSLKAIREKLKVPLLRLSKELELSRTFLSDLEAGRRNWSPELIERYKGVLRELAT